MTAYMQIFVAELVLGKLLQHLFWKTNNKLCNKMHKH